MNVVLDDAFLSYKLYDSVNKNPDIFLDMINIKDIERYYRKTKLRKINEDDYKIKNRC